MFECAPSTGSTAANLEHMAPILALVIQPFIEHFHDLDKVVPADHGASAARAVERSRTDCTTAVRSRSSVCPMAPMGHLMWHPAPLLACLSSPWYSFWRRGGHPCQSAAATLYPRLCGGIIECESCKFDWMKGLVNRRWPRIICSVTL